MDFRNRGAQPHTTQPVTRPTANAAPTTAVAGNLRSKHSDKSIPKWLKITSAALLFSITALLVALTAMLYFGNTGAVNSIKDDKYQAVFLNNGQVYFGNIRGLNSSHVNLQNIYYLQTNGAEGSATTQAANANVSLVKLGCELHGPYDQMLINSDQVIFWENLQDDSQVVKAIDEFVKQNPNGQECSTQAQSSTNQAPTTTTPQTTPPATPNTNRP